MTILLIGVLAYYTLIALGVFATGVPAAADEGGWAPVWLTMFLVIGALWPVWVPLVFIHDELRKIGRR